MRYLNAKPIYVLGFSFLLFAGISLLDLLLPEVSLGYAYLLPIVFASGFLRQWQIVTVSVLAAILREFLGPLPVEYQTILRASASVAAFAASGLFVSELCRNRRIIIEHVKALEEQIALRREAQEQLTVLIDTSPAAILILDRGGSVLMANESAEEMFGVHRGKLEGERIYSYLPALETIPVGEGHRSLRSNLECRGHRFNGSIFLAQVWFSTFQTASGPRVAAIVLDASEGLRDRGGAGLYSLMRTSRILMGAVSHSVRNLCAASKVSFANLARVQQLNGNEDLKALGTLIRGLESISTTQLERTTDRPVSVDLNTLMDELRVVVEPQLEEKEIELVWKVAENLPPVFGEHYGLLHVFLNLTQNSERALMKVPVRRFEVGSRTTSGGVELSFADSAGGVSNPEELFQAFSPGSQGSGLGLYVSRAIVRSFEGNLTYQPIPSGSCFTVSLRAAFQRSNHAATERSN